MIQRFSPDNMPTRGGIHEVVKVGNWAFIAGQNPIDKSNNTIGANDPEAQVEQVYKNLELACNAVGGTLADMVKTTTWITSREYYPAINRARVKHYGSNCPVNATIIVPGLVPPDHLVEIEGIAYIE